MKTWLVVVVASVLGVGAGLGISTARIVQRPWDGTPAGPSGMSSIHPSSGAATSLPLVDVPADKFEFGQMDNTQSGKHSFTIRNIGGANLTLEKGQTTCKCTVADLKTKVLPPGESTEVVLEWKVKDFFGPYKQSASIMTNDPNRSQIRFTISGHVTPVLRISPQGDIGMTGVTAGTSRTETVPLFCYRTKPIRIEGYDLSDPSLASRFEVKFDPMPPDQVAAETEAKSGYLVRITAKPGLPLGAFQQTITLKTDSPEAPTLPVTVKGTVVADITLVGRGVDGSGGLVLGMLSSQDEVERTVTIYTRGPHYKDVKFKVLSTEPDFLQASVGNTTVIPGRELSQTPLVIHIPKGTRPADYLGSEAAKPARITLETGHPQAPQFQVPVRFAVRN